MTSITNSTTSSTSSLRPLFVRLKWDNKVRFYEIAKAYRSLVDCAVSGALIEDNQIDSASLFLQNVQTHLGYSFNSDQLLHGFVPTNEQTMNGFLDSVISLLSVKDDDLSSETLNLLFHVIKDCQFKYGLEIVSSGIFQSILETVSADSNNFSDQQILYPLVGILSVFVSLLTPDGMAGCQKTDVPSKRDSRDSLLVHAVYPSEDIIRSFIDEKGRFDDPDLGGTWMYFLSDLIEATPYHKPISVFVSSLGLRAVITELITDMDDSPLLSILMHQLLNGFTRWSSDGRKSRRSSGQIIRKKSRREMRLLTSAGLADALELRTGQEQAPPHGLDLYNLSNEFLAFFGSNSF